MSKDNFTLKMFKNGRQIKAKGFDTSLDAEEFVYSLTDRLALDENYCSDNICVVDNSTGEKIFNESYQESRGTWRVDTNEFHSLNESFAVDDCMQVASKSSSKGLKEHQSVIAIVPCGDLMPCKDDNSYLRYLLNTDNVDADTLGDTICDLRSGNACGSYVLDNCDNDAVFGDFMQANDGCTDAICCLDDCCTQSPDEFFVSKKCDTDFYPVAKQDESLDQAELDEEILRSRSRNGVHQKLIEVPEDINATIFGKPYTQAEDDINSALKELGFDLEDVEIWRETGDSPIEAADLARALKITKHYTEYDLTEILPVVVQIMKKIGLRIPSGGAQIGSRAAKRQGKTALSDFIHKYVTLPGSGTYLDSFEYDDEY